MQAVGIWRRDIAENLDDCKYMTVEYSRGILLLSELLYQGQRPISHVCPLARLFSSSYILARLLFPGLCGPFFPFIFFVEKPLISPVEAASVLFENLFFPPNPNFSSLFCLLFFDAPRSDLSLADLDDCSSFAVLSSAISKRSSSWVAPVSVFFRSIG